MKSIFFCRTPLTAVLGVFLFSSVMAASVQAATFQDDIGYTELQTLLGGSAPDGDGVRVTQVEATNGNDDWMVNTSNTAEFSGKVIIDQSPPYSASSSGHATMVAKNFYGNSTSIASGITSVDVYNANTWFFNDYLNLQAAAPLASSSRIANHSWVGGQFEDNFGDPLPDITSEVLRRVDWVVETDEFIQVVGTNNGSTVKPLLASAYNVISVGRTDGNHAKGTFALDSDYTAGRVAPHVVAPAGSTSAATPIVSSVAAVLVETAHKGAWSLSNGLTTNRNGDTIYNGERSEVIKALIMAGADRETNNTSTAANITDYRQDVANQTDNGLDTRYGAGQVNVLNSHSMLAAGEQDSSQDGGAATVDNLGFDYDMSFGGDNGSNSTASYQFDTLAADSVLSASLVWNIDIDGSVSGGGPFASFNDDATFYDLDLILIDQTLGTVASSESTNENTENIWFSLTAGHDYVIQVVAGVGQAIFDWDYGLAWQIQGQQIQAVPVPAAAWLFGSALCGLIGLKQRKRIS